MQGSGIRVQGLGFGVLGRLIHVLRWVMSSVKSTGVAEGALWYWATCTRRI